MQNLAGVPRYAPGLNSCTVHAAKPYCRYLKQTFGDLLPCYCDAIKTNSRTIPSQASQPASAGKGADISELQAHHCMTSEQ